MNLLHPELSAPHSPSLATARATRIAGPALLAGSALLLVGAGLALGSQHAAAPPRSSCGLPTGVTLAELEHRDAQRVTRRLLACQDLEAGRITADRYDAAIAAIDGEWTRPAPELVAPPAPSWASTVRGFSSQYTTDAWSAAQALGAPDVVTGNSDNAKAWASLGADDQPEWLEVGFARPRSISGVEIHETFNPGAVGRIELITSSGRTLEVQASQRVAGVRAIGVRCTSEPIVAVRVHLDSVAVAGWNEIDAIGVVPCTP